MVTVAAPGRIERSDVLALFHDWRRSGDPALRDEIAARHLALAGYVAGRFRDRGTSSEDLFQIACVGLLKAIDRFDPDRGCAFSTFATATITGELRHYFRDRSSSVRLPRAVQQLAAKLPGAIGVLATSLDRYPTAEEIARHVGVTVDAVLEASDWRNVCHPQSLDGAPDGRPAGDAVGDVDRELERFEWRASLRPILESLCERDRTLLYLRFFRDLTQTQIAERLGVSQMQVSRLLARTLADVRERLEHAQVAHV